MKELAELDDILKEYSELREYLGLRYSPVAIKFVKKGGEMPEWARKMKRWPIRACQMLMEAKHGNRVVMTEKNTSCPAARAAYGFAPLPEKISSGEMLCNFGLFLDNEAGKKTMEEIPRFSEPCKAVIAAPLEDADFVPDVVVVEDTPEIIMWLLLADLYHEGGRHTLSTSVIQACCVDVTSYVYTTGKSNASFGCYGCREASDLKPDEAMMGFPYHRFERLIGALKEMKAKGPIERVRRKAIYNLYTKQRGSPEKK